MLRNNIDKQLLVVKKKVDIFEQTVFVCLKLIICTVSYGIISERHAIDGFAMWPGVVELQRSLGALPRDNLSVIKGCNANCKGSMNVFLLDVVEVDKADRVRCQAEGCGHSVYARIHVVLDDGHFLVLGGDCFERIYKGCVTEASYYGGTAAAPRRLDGEMRALLEANTVRFVEKLEERRAQIQAELENQRARDRVLAPTGKSKPARTMRIEEMPGYAKALEHARHRLRKRSPEIDWSLSGWAGVVAAEARAIMFESREQVGDHE